MKRKGSNRTGSEKKTEYEIESNTTIIIRRTVLLVMVTYCIER